MFERFTERARQVVVLAQETARTNECRYIGVEHILAGIVREEEGLAARVLFSLHVTPEKVREAVRDLSDGAKPEEGEAARQLPFTPRAKKVIELSLREALGLGHNYIGTEHILLAILREGDNKGLEILTDRFKLTPEKIRKEVIGMLSGPKATQLLKPGSTPDAPPKKGYPNPVVPKDDVITTAVTLGRQYPEATTDAVIKAARLIVAGRVNE